MGCRWQADASLHGGTGADTGGPQQGAGVKPARTEQFRGAARPASLQRVTGRTPVQVTLQYLVVVRYAGKPSPKLRDWQVAAQNVANGTLVTPRPWGMNLQVSSRIAPSFRGLARGRINRRQLPSETQIPAPRKWPWPWPTAGISSRHYNKSQLPGKGLQ